MVLTRRALIQTPLAGFTAGVVPKTVQKCPYIVAFDPAHANASDVPVFWYSYLTKDGKPVFEQIRQEDFIRIAESQMRRKRGVVNLIEREKNLRLIESIKTPSAP